MDHASVLVHLAEEVLTIDKLEPPTPERREAEAKSTKAVFLALRYKPDGIRV
jgi:hypothetical protein